MKYLRNSLKDFQLNRHRITTSKSQQSLTDILWKVLYLFRFEVFQQSRVDIKKFKSAVCKIFCQSYTQSDVFSVPPSIDLSAFEYVKTVLRLYVGYNSFTMGVR